jgi:hypothetical protein
MMKLISWVRGFFPTALPKGSNEFDLFCNSILSIYNIPDFPSYRRTIASLVMHLGPTTTHVPKVFFGRSIRKAMANQVAFDKIQQYKQEEQDLQKARLAEKPEATTSEPLDVTAA